MFWYGNKVGVKSPPPHQHKKGTQQSTFFYFIPSHQQDISVYTRSP